MPLWKLILKERSPAGLIFLLSGNAAEKFSFISLPLRLGVLLLPVSFEELSVPEVEFESWSCCPNPASYLGSNSQIRLTLTDFEPLPALFSWSAVWKLYFYFISGFQSNPTTLGFAPSL